LLSVQFVASKSLINSVHGQVEFSLGRVVASGRSEAHLSAREICQLRLGRTTFEVDFEVHDGEVGG